MAKRNTGTTREDAPLVIGLGPGFTAGVDCHAVVETHRGHWLGRVYWQGSALPDTGTPGEIGGTVVAGRVLRAPTDGILLARAAIGDQVTTGQVVATVAGSELSRWLRWRAVARLIRSGARVAAGVKVGDIDPRRRTRLLLHHLRQIAGGRRRRPGSDSGQNAEELTIQTV